MSKIDEKVRKEAKSMYHTGGLSNREIARRLGIAESTLRSWIKAQNWWTKKGSAQLRDISQKSALAQKHSNYAEVSREVDENVNHDEKTQCSAKDASPYTREKKTLICEICQQPIASFDPEKVKLPLKGDMFLSHEPDRGLPAPFHESLGVFDFRCPWCPNLPFHAEFNTVEDADPNKFPARLKTPDGYVKINRRIDSD